MSDINRFGSDILLRDGDIIPTPNGDIMVSQDYEDNNPDVNQFPGYYSMIFNLMDRLMTIKGDNVFHKEYGSNLPTLLSSPNSPDLKRKVQEVINQGCLEDSRVQSVKYVNVEQNGSMLSCKAGIVLAGDTKIFEMVFPNFIIE